MSTEPNLNWMQCTFRSIMFRSTTTAFPNQLSAACRSGFRERSWNIQKHFLKYCDKFQTSREISQEFFSDNWQHCASNCFFVSFGQSILKVILSCICVRVRFMYLQSRLTDGYSKVPRHHLMLACKRFQTQRFREIRTITFEGKRLGDTALTKRIALSRLMR